MQEEINIKISQFLDGQLDKQQAEPLLRAVKKDPAVKEAMMRYQIIGQAIRADSQPIANLDLADKVSQQIKQEPAYLLPSARKSPDWKAASMAVAASIAVVAIVAPLTAQRTQPGNGSQTVVASVETSENTVVASAEEKAKRAKLNQRFKEYLQAHQNSVDATGVMSYTPYARVAGYSQGR